MSVCVYMYLQTCARNPKREKKKKKRKSEGKKIVNVSKGNIGGPSKSTDRHHQQ